MTYGLMLITNTQETELKFDPVKDVIHEYKHFYSKKCFLCIGNG